ncbi:MAG: GTPase HflX [Planctomycetota bacterium]|jgi:GTP-binding protein HflX|nr:GTPase HflX [Planctomycetota bacterium]
MRDRTSSKKLNIDRERCLLCAVLTPDRALPGEDPLEEIARLVDTAGGDEAGRLAQRLDRPIAKTYFGKGKLSELAAAAAAGRAETVVVDDDLSPKQLSALEDACGRKVIDRNEVILDIFQSNARTRQAQLQVELAQSQYELPRLARKWTHLERLGGGIGTRGPGESQIETDRRLLRRRIQSLKSELAGMEARKERELAGRGGLFSACLVGYTNAGKSSLLNRLANADALVEDRLFATLDTLTRRVALGDGLEMLLSDTVGFIRRLPHHLVASFHATLAEAARADLLIQAIDASDPMCVAQAASVDETLRAIGIGDIPRVHALNKMDRPGAAGLAEALGRKFSPAFPVSARTGQGLAELSAYLGERAAAGLRQVRLRFNSGDGRRLAMASAVAAVSDRTYDGPDVILTARINPADLERLKRLPGRMRLERGAAGQAALAAIP